MYGKFGFLGLHWGMFEIGPSNIVRTTRSSNIGLSFRYLLTISFGSNLESGPYIHKYLGKNLVIFITVALSFAPRKLYSSLPLWISLTQVLLKSSRVSEASMVTFQKHFFQSGILSSKLPIIFQLSYSGLFEKYAQSVSLLFTQKKKWKAPAVKRLSMWKQISSKA